MKKFFNLKVTVTAIIIALIQFVSIAASAAANTYCYAAETDKISVYINNEQIDFASEPIMENGRTLVPMRRIFEELGAEVTWDNDTNTATAVKDNTEIKITVDSDIMLKKGEAAIKLDAPARLIDDAYTYVPLRAVSEAFGCTVDWNEDLNRVDILTDIYNNLSIDEVNAVLKFKNISSGDLLQTVFENVGKPDRDVGSGIYIYQYDISNDVRAVITSVDGDTVESVCVIVGGKAL